MLEFKNVSKIFHGPSGDVQALQNVSLSVSRGELVAIQGPSGCGKTTLLLIAGALLKPGDGEVLVDGKNPYSLPPERRSTFRAEHVGFVFQQFHLIPYLTVLDNVLAPSVVWPQPDSLDRARELIDHFNLQHRIKHVPAELSTGERQRTALARALLNRPKFLLADEPTGNLDGESADTVLEYLSDFAASEGGVLLVTHDQRVTEYAHRSIRMQDGKVSWQPASTLK